MKKICKKLLVALLAIMITFTTLSAGNPAEVQAASAPTLSYTTKSLRVGAKVKLKVNNLPDKATVKWSSSNTEAITVSKGGTIKGVKAGKATITCTVTTKKTSTAKAKTYTLKCYVNCSADYLTKHNRTITRTGKIAKCPIMTKDYQAKTQGKDGKIVYVPAKVTVETTDNGNGYSDTVFTVEWDCSSLAGGTYVYMWYTAFDRYTGANFEAKKSLGVSKETGKVYQLNINNIVYKIKCSSKNYGWIDDTTMKSTFTVHHPSDYDGLVFQLDAYSSAHESINYNKAFRMYDYKGLVTKKSLFFTATNK